jgi:hypothetical protein
MATNLDSEPSVKHPGNFVGSDWLDSDDVKDLAYGLRVNALLAMLALKGLRAYEANVGTPTDDVYELVDSLVHTVATGAGVLARKLDALPEEDA